MNLRKLGVYAAAAALALVSGCGGGGKTTVTNPPAVEKLPAQAEAPAPQGLGLSQAQLLKGFSDQIKLEQVEMRTAEGHVFMGNTTDGAERQTKLVVYGSPDAVTHAYFTAVLPYAEFPDAAKYPDYMVRNLKLQELFLANLFGTPPPGEIAAALEWARNNPKQDKIVSVGGKSVKITYGQPDKKIAIDVK